jgi:hypothetical protein
LKLYRERLDKTYSHVDCMAMVICKRRKITGTALEQQAPFHVRIGPASCRL